MSFEAMLAARAHREGRAQRTAVYRHRAIARNPLCIVAWQWGQEAYSVGAIAMGTQSSGPKLFVPGFPLDRELLFRELTGFARQFCSSLEAYQRGATTSIEHWGQDLDVPKQLPQIIVANAETIGLLGRLGRRLAYLPTDGDHPADPVLPRMGRHLQWLFRRAYFPGQQLLLSATDLLNSHYATSMSSYELGSLSAIDAWIAPRRGVHGFEAAERAERQAVGPTPDPKDAERIYKAIMEFNAARAGSREPALVRRLVEPIRAIYEPMVQDTWDLVWKVVDRERQTDEASSVGRRVLEDRIEYARHMVWMDGPADGRVRTRQDPRSAALRLNEYERANSTVIAEEAIDDPLRMAPILLSGKAIAGNVTRVEEERRETINNRSLRRPSVTLRTNEPCAVPTGSELWWTNSPKGREWVVDDVVARGDGSDVTLVLQTSHAPDVGMPAVGDRACFSVLNTKDGYEINLPKRIPWTHRPTDPPAAETDLEASEAA
jgi:hypothetical protein